MAKLFYSYSHADEALRDQLDRHLSSLKRSGAIKAWHDREIKPGQLWDDEIRRKLDEADVILFLVSADFLASDYCHDVEVQHALERHERGEAVVIPVILRHCDWKNSPLGNLQATPTDGIPVASHLDKDEALLAVVTDIRRTLNSREQRNIDSSTPSAPSLRVPEPSGAQDRTRVLPKSWQKPASDLEKDDFLRHSFGVVLSTFESKLRDIESVEAAATGRIEREGDASFTLSLYLSGTLKAKCRIWLGSPFASRGIAYSSGTSWPSDNSFNEFLTPEESDNALTLRTMMGSLSGGQNQNLTAANAADYLWSRFLGEAR